jgi:hypothetical protein
VDRIVDPKESNVIGLFQNGSALGGSDLALDEREVIRMRRDVERLARIETEAGKMAPSGEYQGADAVEMALLTQGYPEAHTVFGNKWSQAELDRLCARARLRRRSLQRAEDRAVGERPPNAATDDAMLGIDRYRLGLAPRDAHEMNWVTGNRALKYGFLITGFLFIVYWSFIWPNI